MRNSTKYMLFVLGMFMVCIGLFLILFAYPIQFDVENAYGITDTGAINPGMIDAAIISIAFGFAFIITGILTAEEEMSEIETDKDKAPVKLKEEE